MHSVVEKKWRDLAATAYACDTTGSVTLINGVAQGTDSTNRIGRKYTNVAVQIEGIILPQDTTTAIPGNKCRVMLIHDAQPNGALPAVTDILNASNAAAFMNLDNRDRFRVLSDTNVSLGGLDTTATMAVAGAPTIHNVSVYRRIEIETICDGTTAAIADINSGSLLLLTIGAQVPSSGHNLVAAIRVRFTDQ